MHDKELDHNVLDQIIYRGEGNSSIVIALKTQAKVLRLLKKDGKIMRSSQDHHVTQHPMRSIKFIHLIMKPLTNPFLTGATELIHLKSEFINLLSKWVEQHRPIHRLDKTLLLDDQYALVMDDLCTLPTNLTKQLQNNDLCGPTISVEIKPKQGFLPMHRLVMKPTTNEQFTLNMRNCCLYGSAQFLKLAKGRISHTSDYCPINLFSGCPIRMRNALEELVKNPQNNFRVFKDLVFAYGESKEDKMSNILGDFLEREEQVSSWLNPRSTTEDEERLLDLIIQCLLHDPDQKDCELSRSQADDENYFNGGDSCLQHPVKVKCKRCDTYPSSKKHKPDSTSSTHKLPQACVLSSVLRAQKLDSIGPHEAYNMLEWLLAEARTNGEHVDILEELSKPQMPQGFGTPHQLPSETKQQYYFRKVWEFLVSLTAKDCSIIVTIRRITNGHYDSIVDCLPSAQSHILREPRSGCYYLFNVGIADLDQKMPLKIPRIVDNLNLILQTRGDGMNKDKLIHLRRLSHKLIVNNIE